MSISHLLTDSLWFAEEKDLAKNDAGDPDFERVSCIAARVEARTQVAIGTDGNEKQSNNSVATECEIPLCSVIWFAREDVGNLAKSVRPIQVKTARTPGGFRFYETLL